jgi:type IV pilus assembly protein PilM
MLGLSTILRKESVVGIDVGSRLTKVCYAEPIGNGRYRVTRTSFTTTPPDSVRDGVIIDKAAVAMSLRELMRAAGLNGITGANAAIAGASVIVRHVKLPRMPESALRKSIRFEAAKYISTSIEDSCIEFEILGPVDGEPDKMNVMLVAAPNEMINSRIQTLEMAGLEPVAIDIEAFAVQRALMEIANVTGSVDDTIALLDIGANSTDVTIVARGYFALTRHIPIAGDHFTNAIRNAKLCTFEEAEEIKMTVDMSTLLSPDATPEEQTIAHMVQPVLDELLREVRRSVNYYQSQFAEGAISLPAEARGADLNSSTAGRVGRLVITGGSALLKGIQQYMEVRLGTSVELGNIFEASCLDTTQLMPGFIDSHHSVFSLCTGLAVKRTGAANSNHSGSKASGNGGLMSALKKKKTIAPVNLTLEIDKTEEAEKLQEVA